MPSRYVIRNFAENAYYHIFNRGVEKRKVFLDNQDYNMFLYYAYIYLMPLEQVLVDYPNLPLRLQSKNLNKEIDLVAYCLMPNHFHLLLKQVSLKAISKFVKQLINAYTFYFNKKYNRVGTLFQGRFKAVIVETDELLWHVSRYIHLNPVIAEIVQSPKDYKWSSYLDYIGKENKIKTSKEIIFSQFPSAKSYEDFVLDQISYARELDKIKHLLLED